MSQQPPDCCFRNMFVVAIGALRCVIALGLLTRVACCRTASCCCLSHYVPSSTLFLSSFYLPPPHNFPLFTSLSNIFQRKECILINGHIERTLLPVVWRNEESPGLIIRGRSGTGRHALDGASDIKQPPPQSSPPTTNHSIAIFLHSAQTKKVPPQHFKHKTH